MPNIDLDAPYKNYIDRMIASGLYKTTAEVVKDALRMHMNQDTKAKKMAEIHAAIAVGEADIAAGRYTEYTIDTLDDLIKDIETNA